MIALPIIRPQRPCTPTPTPPPSPDSCPVGVVTCSRSPIRNGRHSENTLPPPPDSTMRLRRRQPDHHRRHPHARFIHNRASARATPESNAHTSETPGYKSPVAPAAPVNSPPSDPPSAHENPASDAPPPAPSTPPATPPQENHRIKQVPHPRRRIPNILQHRFQINPHGRELYRIATFGIIEREPFSTRQRKDDERRIRRPPSSPSQSVPAPSPTATPAPPPPASPRSASPISTPHHTPLPHLYPPAFAVVLFLDTMSVHVNDPTVGVPVPPFASW